VSPYLSCDTTGLVTPEPVFVGETGIDRVGEVVEFPALLACGGACPKYDGNVGVAASIPMSGICATSYAAGFGYVCP